MELSDYPERALEEGLVNAFIHRSYLQTGAHSQVDIYDDRIVITNPGGMFDGSEVQLLDIRHVPSKLRKPILADDPRPGIRYEEYEPDKFHCIFVEDDTTLNQGLCKALKEKDRQIVSCESISEAKEQLSLGTGSFVLLDINLPDGSGLDLLKEIKGKTPNVPVILLTANDTDKDIVTGLEQGADDYITKPFSLAVLRARVNTQLRKTNHGNDLGDSYGVLVGAGPEKLSAMLEYDTVVLDAQFFSKKDVKRLHQAGCRVFSYINVGSIENFRPYYQKYRDITIGAYENWDEEKWVDVSCKRWQKFILQELAPAIRGKGVDGLFVDNTDVSQMILN